MIQDKLRTIHQTIQSNPKMKNYLYYDFTEMERAIAVLKKYDI